MSALDPEIEERAETALRAIQKYDEVVRGVDFRYLLIEAETALGEILGLDCTGDPGGWDADGKVVAFDHNGGTCPVHEWLVESDQAEIMRAAHPEAFGG